MIKIGGPSALVLAVGLAVAPGGQATTASPPAQTTNLATAVSKLRDEPTYIAPSSLVDLTQTAEAAIVARIVSLGELRVVPALDKQEITMKESVDGFAAYRVAISEVLYNRLKTAAPPLRPGAETELTKMVGRQEAEAFLARQTPVRPGDECVLFLWHRRGAAEWSLLQWPLQFRKSIPTPDGVETISALPGGRKLLSADWLGPSVPLVVTGKAHSWSALVERVRQTGK